MNDSGRGRSLQSFFIFIRCETGRASSIGLEVARKKKNLVREMSSISVEWDLLLLVQIESGTDVGREVASLFSDIDGILRTSTVAAFRIWAEGD